MTIIPILIGVLGTDTTGLVQGLEGLKKNGTSEDCLNYSIFEIIRIPRRVLETWGDLLPLKLK